MTSSIFWCFGFLYWMATIPFSYAEKCTERINLAAPSCSCSISNKIVLLQNCQDRTFLNVPDLYSHSNPKTVITICNSQDIVLGNNVDNFTTTTTTTTKEMREVYLLVENITKVEILENTFDQVVIHAVFRNITEFTLLDKSFLGCWGSVWFSNIKNISKLNAFTSSDMVFHDGSSFTIHNRPKVTPRQKFIEIYEVSAKLYDLEITINAVLALIGAVILTLISLTIVVARKFVSSSVPLEKLPDVVQITSPVQTRNKNPVIKVSRISRAVFPNRGANKGLQRVKANNSNQRPPLPLPRDI